MRIWLIIAFCLTASATQARPSPYPPPDQFSGDRYTARQTQLGPEVARSVKAKQGAKHRSRAATEARQPRSRDARERHKRRPAPFPAPRPLAEPGSVEPLSVAGGAWREAKRAVGRPRDHRGRLLPWCGWWLGQHLGMARRDLWLARNWARVGSNAGGPRIGAIVVWAHHVGIITGRQGNRWVVKSGNDGRRVRERPRSIAGAIAFRRV